MKKAKDTNERTRQRIYHPIQGIDRIETLREMENRIRVSNRNQEIVRLMSLSFVFYGLGWQRSKGGPMEYVIDEVRRYHIEADSDEEALDQVKNNGEEWNHHSTFEIVEKE